jgi:large subunit ribosomal protein L19
MNATIRKIEDGQIIRKNVTFKVGDTVKVSLRIKEGEKERIQVYEGLVIGIQGSGGKMKFTVRKISYGVGVEKTFYYQSPMIKEVKVNRSGKVRRGKLFYLRGKLSKKEARIQEGKKDLQVFSEGTTETVTAENVEIAPVEAPEAPKAEAAPAESVAPSTPAPTKAEAPKVKPSKTPKTKAAKSEKA